MKFSVKLFSLLVAALLMFSVTVNAADSYITINGFSFDINSDGKAVIHGYDGDIKDVVIPKKLLGAEVVAIDDYAFFGNTEITSVSFENCDGLKSIGDSAFYGCTGVKEITLPSSLNELGFGAFQDCSELESVTFKSGLTTISNQCFYNCDKLKKVVVPESVETLGDRCFGGCDSLVDIEIPNSVSSISANAFENSENVVIYCNYGSYAREYAEANSVESGSIREYSLGDVDMDGEITVVDATIIQKYKIGKSELPIYRGNSYADVSGDGKVSVRDATLIQMYVANMIESF